MIFILFSVLDLCTCKRLMVEAFNSKIISTISAKSTAPQSFGRRVSNDDHPPQTLLSNKISHGLTKTLIIITGHQVWSSIVVPRNKMVIVKDKKNHQRGPRKNLTYDRHRGKALLPQKLLQEDIHLQCLLPDLHHEALLLWKCQMVVLQLQAPSQNNPPEVRLQCQVKGLRCCVHHRALLQSAAVRNSHLLLALQTKTQILREQGGWSHHLKHIWNQEVRCQALDDHVMSYLYLHLRNLMKVIMTLEKI